MQSFLLSKSPNLVTAHDEFLKSKRSAELSLEEFIAVLPETIHQVKKQDKAETTGDHPDLIADLMERLVLDPEDYVKYAHYDPSRNYTRNLVSSDGTSYTLVFLCWNPGRESPIHDHPCDGCWMRVCTGTIQECRFVKNPVTDTLECTLDEIYQEGDSAYIRDSMGYHKVGNPSQTTPAISLHLYCPPFSKCKIWMNANQSKPSQSCVCYYSEYGTIMD